MELGIGLLTQGTRCPANRNQAHSRQQTSPLIYKSMRIAE